MTEIPEPSLDPNESRIRSSVGRQRPSYESIPSTESVSDETLHSLGDIATDRVTEIVPVIEIEPSSLSRVRSSVGRSRPEATEPGPVSRVRANLSRTPKDSVELATERRLPTFEALLPESNTVKTFLDKEGAVDLRLSSSKSHQDGLAYNPESDTVVVCDGMGGPGVRGDVKDFFGFALSHAVAEIEDISTLRNPGVAMATVERAKSILENDLGIKVSDPGSKVKSHPVEWGSTIAAVQKVKDTETNRWRVATIGDSSVVLIDSSGKIKQGFGEAFQLIGGESWKDTEGTSLGTYVGLAKGSLDGWARYDGPSGTHAEFTEVELSEGERLVVVSDAYIQKTNFGVLEADVAKSSAEWAAAKPNYGDDTTMAIVR
jgi:hypothetical protein